MDEVTHDHPHLHSIAAFGAASQAVDDRYRRVGRLLGRRIAERGMTLVWGAGDVSLMGEFGLGALLAGGRAYGVTIPHLVGLECNFAHLSIEERKALGNRAIFQDIDEATRARLRVDIVDTMHERKRRMSDAADGFVICTGGYGTMEEAFEILALDQLGAVSKPLAFLDVDGLYEGLFSFLDGLLARGILRPEERGLALRAGTPDDAFDAMERWMAREAARRRHGLVRGVPGADANGRAMIAGAVAAAHELDDRGAADVVSIDPPTKSGISVAASHRCTDNDTLMEAAQQMGRLVARSGERLICGGAPTGLQGAMARACIEAGGEVVGVTTRALHLRDGWVKGLSETYVVDTMRQRKFVMQQLSSACAVLPGGYETLEQAMEYLCWKQIGVQDKPLIFVNVDDVYTPLLGFFDTLAREGFIKPADPAQGRLVADRDLALDAPTPLAAMRVLGYELPARAIEPGPGWRISGRPRLATTPGPGRSL